MLERFGILQLIRARGFKVPLVNLELDHPLGQTLRIFGDPDRRELLVELRLHRSTRAVPECEVLDVEWMLLQNPRQVFSGSRPALPGQQHPGLGMLPEFFGWLVVLSEALGLDGALFHPNHYHVAALSRRHARFLDPRAEALLRALQSLLGGMTLDEASRAVEDGRVLDASTGKPLTWEGWPMVLPTSARLRERTEGRVYEEAVVEAGASLQLALVPREVVNRA